MGAKNPKIAGWGDNILRNPGGNVVVGTGLLRALFRSFVKDHVNLAEREACNLNVIELHVLKKLKLDRQGVAIPPASSASLLSAMTYARRSASVMSARTTIGSNRHELPRRQ